jgi:hypothetical protein
VSYFYNGLGLPQDYFDRYDDGEIAQHLTAFMSAKKLAASADPTIGKDATQVRVFVCARVCVCVCLCSWICACVRACVCVCVLVH